jgi:hypothetical protein
MLTHNLTSFQCAPAVAEFTASRKRSWAQKVLAGRPALPGYNELFAEGVYNDAPAVAQQQTLMSCIPVQETQIENNTCVLGTLRL